MKNMLKAKDGMPSELKGNTRDVAGWRMLSGVFCGSFSLAAA